jgi:hypothetical protein
MMILIKIHKHILLIYLDDDEDVYLEYYSGKGFHIDYSVYMSYVNHINSSNTAEVTNTNILPALGPFLPPSDLKISKDPNLKKLGAVRLTTVHFSSNTLPVYIYIY